MTLRRQTLELRRFEWLFEVVESEDIKCPP